jgi:DNA recombination protein RmuC
VTTTELVLLILLGAAVAFLIGLLRRRRPEDATALVHAEVSRIADALGRQNADERELRGDMGRVRELVEGLRASSEARVRAEEPVWHAVRRIESVLAGKGSRGKAGENLLEEALSHLPPGMLVRDFAIGGRRVEFALVLPDGRRLPVDSKWTAVRELEELRSEADEDRRTALCKRIEDEVARRAREAEAYLDPALTTPFAVACVPDAAFGVCRKAHADAFARGVILVPYASALPVLLSLYALAARYGAGDEVQGCLAELEGLISAMAQTLENKVTRATTMLQNASDEWRTHVGRARGALARGRGVGAVADGSLDQIETGLTSGFDEALIPR